MREDIMLQLAKEIAAPQTHFAQTLIEIMTIADFKVAQQALELLMQIFDNRRNMCIEIPHIQLLQVDGIMDPLVVKYTQIYKNIFEEKSKVTGIKDPERNCGEVVQLFSAVNTQLTDLISDFSYKIEEDHAIKLKAKGLILKHGLKVELPKATIATLNNQKGYGAQYSQRGTSNRDYNTGMTGKAPPSKGNYMNLFNEVLLNLDKLDLKQSLLTNIGIIDICFDTLIYCQGDYLQYPRHYKKKIFGQFFSDNVLFGKGEYVEWNMFLRNDLVVKCMITLYYACLKNMENQQYIRKKIDSNLKILFDLFYSNCPYSITKYFLALINNVYCTNLTILIKIP